MVIDVRRQHLYLVLRQRFCRRNADIGVLVGGNLRLQLPHHRLVFLFAQLLHQCRAVARVKNGEIAAQPGGKVFFLQNLKAEAVKGGNVQAARRLAKQRPHPFAHFARRLVGEG